MGTRFENAKRTKRLIDLGLSGAIASGAVTTEKLGQLVKPWVPDGKKYLPGDSFSYDGKIYGVVQEHTSSKSYDPKVTPALAAYLGLGTESKPDEHADWVQPKGAHDAYKKGDIRKDEGKLWVSTVDNNAWKPGVYGWIIYESP